MCLASCLGPWTPSADTSTLRRESLVGPSGCRRSCEARVMVVGVSVGLSPSQAFVLAANC